MRVLDPKDPGEKILVTFDFSDALRPGELIVSADTVTVSVEKGEDANSNATLGQASTLAGGVVQQYFIGGVRGVDYHLSTYGSTNSSPSRKLLAEAIVPVR